jgi:hypothetical protein
MTPTAQSCSFTRCMRPAPPASRPPSILGTRPLMACSFIGSARRGEPIRRQTEQSVGLAEPGDAVRHRCDFFQIELTWGASFLFRSCGRDTHAVDGSRSLRQSARDLKPKSNKTGERRTYQAIRPVTEADSRTRGICRSGECRSGTGGGPSPRASVGEKKH